MLQKSERSQRRAKVQGGELDPSMSPESHPCHFPPRVQCLQLHSGGNGLILKESSWGERRKGTSTGPWKLSAWGVWQYYYCAGWTSSLVVRHPIQPLGGVLIPHSRASVQRVSILKTHFLHLASYTPSVDLSPHPGHALLFRDVLQLPLRVKQPEMSFDPRQCDKNFLRCIVDFLGRETSESICNSFP